MNKILWSFIILNSGLTGGHFMQPVLASQLSEGNIALENESVKEDDGNDKILYWVAPMDANYRRDKAGKSPMGMDLVPVYASESAKEDNSNDKILYWVAPMDANYRRDKAGKSPMGMDLVPVYAADVTEDDIK